MKDSEKKAREIKDAVERLDDLFYTTFGTNDKPVLDWVRVKFELKDLVEAERRGFERARNLAISWFANNGYEALKHELENLRYEDLTHDEREG